MKTLFFVIPFSLYLNANASGQCQQAKATAKRDCSPAMLEQARVALDGGSAAISGTGQGAANTTRDSISSVQAAMAQSNIDSAKCKKSIETCSTQCNQQAQQENAQMQAALAQQSLAAAKECTQGEPQRNLQAAKKNEMDMSKMLAALMQLLAALMGQDKGQNPQTAAQDTSCRGTGAGTAACTQAANNTTSDFTTGGYRDGEGAAGEGDLAMAANDPAAGTAKGLEYSKGFGGGGAGGGGMAGAGGISPSSSRARDDIGKDNSPRINFGAGAGGGGSGGGRGGGGGGPMMANHNNAPSTKSSEGIDKQVQIAADKALQARGLASDGPLGGITGAHSLDNFTKVERRINAERNGLREH